MLYLVLQNISTSLKSFKGKYKEAEPLYKRSLDILETSFGEIHPAIITVLKNMAGFYQSG